MNLAAAHRRTAALATAACAAIAGSLIMQQLPAPPGPVTGAALCLVALALARATSAIWALWLVVGLLWTALAVDRRLADALPASLAGSDFRLAGWVDDFPDRGDRQTRFSLRVLQADRPEVVPQRLRLSWYDPPFEIEPGQVLELEVRLRSPRGLSNPGVFDYERWLFDERYGATGYVRTGEPGRRQEAGLAREWFAARAGLADKLAAAWPDPDAAALGIALAIGERHRFDDRHWEAFRRTGTSHLVAISGLHVGLVAAFSFWLARRLWLCCLPGAIAHYDLFGAATASFVCAALYALAAGFGVPTQRALVMLTVALVAIVGRRRVHMAAALSTAALFVLLLDPLSTSSPSFWLSFIAVALLWQLAEIRRPVRNDRWSSARDTVRIQWQICLGLLPVTAYFFAEVSLVAPVVNLAAIPFVSFAVVPATLVAAITTALDAGAGVLALPAGVLNEVLWRGLEFAGQWRYSALRIPGVCPMIGALAMLGVILMLPVHPLPGRYLAAVAILPMFLSRPVGPTYGSALVTVLDVGHGLAIVVRTRDHVLLFDTGPSYASGFDTGADIVIPSLRSLGIRFVDTIVVSHADNDHAGGLMALLERYPQARVIAGADVELPRAATCEAGHVWSWDGVDFEFLHPPSGSALHGNDGSCVLRIAAGNDAILMAGDIEAAGERSLLSRGVDIAAPYVIVPHHGSATSSSHEFVAAAKADYAIVSSAYGNRWGFPRPEVRERWESAGAAVVTTAEGGALSIQLGEAADRSVAPRRAGRRRYWHPWAAGDSGESRPGAL